MYFWEKSEYTIGNIRVFTTPNEPKYNNVLRDTRSLQEKLEDFANKYGKSEPNEHKDFKIIRDTRSLQEKLEDFEREFWKDEPIVINTKR